MNFFRKLDRIQNKNVSLLCVGLDPDYQKLPSKFKREKNALFEFNKFVIDSTYPLVCAYKLQLAYYTALGAQGFLQLKRTVDYIKSRYPEIPVICDGKRGDIKETNKMYARELFDNLNADAATVNPYLGFDSLKPFFERHEKGVIVLCKTSNPKSNDLQDLMVGKDPLFIKIAKKVVKADKKYKNLMMVVGARYTNHLKKVREIAPKMTFLVPGIGEQGGNLRKTLKNGLRKDGRGLIISASRSIIYDRHPKQAAQNLRNEINRQR